MSYVKRALPLAELACHLQSLGLEGDRHVIEERIRDVGYYRLSPYWRHFRQNKFNGESCLTAGTSIDQVWQFYVFDRELRLLLLDAIERFEVGVRARLVQHHVEAHGPFGYADPAVHARHNPRFYARLLNGVADSLSDAIKDPTDRRVTEAMKHFAISYGAKHSHPPFWLAAEAFSFGNLVTAYKASPAPIRKAVARGFSISEPVFESWLLTLHTIRNVCAHHCRIWNRKLGTQPMLPQKVPLWNLPELGRRDRIFYSITVLAYCMSTLCDASTWGERFRKLVEETHPHIPTRPMGIGNGWKEHVVWNHSLAGLTGPVPIGAQPRGA